MNDRLDDNLSIVVESKVITSILRSDDGRKKSETNFWWWPRVASKHLMPQFSFPFYLKLSLCFNIGGMLRVCVRAWVSLSK